MVVHARAFVRETASRRQRDRMLSWILGGEEGENRAGKLAMGFGATGLGIATAAAPGGEAAASMLMGGFGADGGVDIGVIIYQEFERNGMVGMPRTPSGSRFNPQRSSSPAIGRSNLKSLKSETEHIYKGCSQVPEEHMGRGPDHPNPSFAHADFHMQAMSYGMAGFGSGCDPKVIYMGLREQLRSWRAEGKESARSSFALGIFYGMFHYDKSEMAEVFAEVFAGGELPERLRKFEPKWAPHLTKLLEQNPNKAGQDIGSAFKGIGNKTLRGELGAVVDFLFDMKGMSMVKPSVKPSWNFKTFMAENFGAPTSDTEEGTTIQKLLAGFIQDDIQESLDPLEASVLQTCILNNKDLTLGAKLLYASMVANPGKRLNPFG